jgi:hypothetical protein
MSRRVSILGAVAVMTVLVLATVAVALAQEEPPDEPQNEVGGGRGQEKITICHNDHVISVASPAWPAHERHGDTRIPSSDTEPENSGTEPENGTTELENGDTELENPEDACETAGAPPEEPSEDATLTTDATDTAQLPTGTISDSATLGIDVPNGADGTIEFKLYGPFTTAPTEETATTDCVAAKLVTAYDTDGISTKPVTNHNETGGTTNPYTSLAFTPTQPGIYQWTATYTPDAGQGDPTGEIGCGVAAEQSVVSGEAIATTGTEQNMTLAGEIGEAANLADPATDTTNIEGTTQNGNITLGTDIEDDVLYGGSSANKLLGGHGNDYLDGGRGRDRMVGGKGADRINGAEGKPGDVINGGIGTDYCVGDVGDVIRNCDGNVVKVPLPSEAAAPAEARN